ncbi:MAG: hypothetical protein JSV05_05290 [Candidatus Bathyarchaeota archaeon]|nr:MAG: hypothetical protein JSV05_05290 [Candidatus Bathyarchaeota archaeon]
MRKAMLLILFFAFASVFLLIPHVNAASPSEIQVETVEHEVAPIYGGLLLINDTIQVSSTNGEVTIENFSISFPLEYRDNLCFSMAYSLENFEQFPIVLNTGLGIVGYYGVTVAFPDGGIQLSANQTFAFKVIFILSDLISSSTRFVNATEEYLFTVNFPLFPSLAQDTICNVTIALPKGTTYIPNSFPFGVTEVGEQQYLNYTEIVPKFTQKSIEISFLSETKDNFACYFVNKLDQEILVDMNGFVSISELYLLKSKTAFTMRTINLRIPSDAMNVSAFDELGKELSVALFDNETISVSLGLVEDQARSVKLIYRLYGESYFIPRNSGDYELILTNLKHMRVIPKISSVRIIFPEGATVESFPYQELSIQRDVFQETLFVSYSNVTWLQSNQWNFTFNYTLLWSAFRPTIWVTVLVIIGSVIAFAMQRPKAPLKVSEALVSPSVLRNFVQTYEEKKLAISQLGQLKQRAQKGKISRRRYKVRKTTLENRLSTISKRLTELQQKIMSGGVKYADIMRGLEIAETELDNIEADIRRIETRFKRGEISAQTYRRLLENDLRRREKVKTTIDGVLLRLKE